MTNIYVGNLDFSTHEDQLQTLFAAYGAVETVTAVTDRDTGQPYASEQAQGRRTWAILLITDAARPRQLGSGWADVAWGYQLSRGVRPTDSLAARSSAAGRFQ